MIVGDVSSYFGTLPGWLTLGTLVLLAATLWRGGHPQAVTILREDNGVLKNENRKLSHEVVELKNECERLKIATSFEPMVEKVVNEFIRHEQSAQLRHDQAMAIFGMIAERLGADPNGQERAA